MKPKSVWLLPLVVLAGCGLFYQAHTRVRAYRMTNSLAVGESAHDVRSQWGVPDIIDAPPPDIPVVPPPDIPPADLPDVPTPQRDIPGPR